LQTKLYQLSYENVQELAVRSSFHLW